MLRLRVSKYDPQMRDALGRFLPDEFTSISDIGKCFANKLMTAGDYVQVEDCYVAAVWQFLSAAHVSSLQVRDLEARPESTVLAEIAALRPAQLNGITNGMILRGGNIDTLVRLLLREQLWCRLVGEHGAFIHVGYDLYLYFGCDDLTDDLGAPHAGLFFEPFTSPYEIP